ncbi:MAG: thioesterase family protein [Actinomycetota bacterium]
MAHRTSLDVRFNEIDPYGHVNHSVYVTYFEVGRTDALTACGIPLEAMAADGFQLVVTHIDVRYRGAATAGDTLVVETAIGRMRRASGTWHQRILRARPAKDGAAVEPEEVLVTAEVTAGVTDSAGKPTRPPDWLFPALEPLRIEPAEDGTR